MKKMPSKNNLDFSRIVRYANLIAFLLLIVVSIIVVANNWSASFHGVTHAWCVILPTVIVLVSENAVKTWALKSFRAKIVCYVLDVLLLLLLTIFTNAALISLLYIIILTQFYIERQSLVSNAIMGAVSIGLYLVTFIAVGALEADFLYVDIVAVFSESFNDLILLVLHFFVINFSLQIVAKNREITAAMKELGETNEKLQRLNEELKEITALEERQRIAKDIHDTAGHSITTVIMQTEAAKLILSDDPEEALRRIAAANLQAKHALEELRESVHLLSGASEALTLKEALMRIIHETTDGTNITVRCEIDEIDVCDAKRRFICNTLKEGISNGLRHGHATAFWFELKREGSRIYFLLSDNGSGMEIDSFKEGFGLSGMHKRAESLGGTVWFETEPDEGFEIHIMLPTDGNDREDI